MNDEQRAALARSIHNALNEYPRNVSVTTEDGKRRVENYTPEGEMEAIEKAIASFTPPPPDADAVEAVAKAIYHASPRGVDYGDLPGQRRAAYKNMARAAIAAMPDRGNGDWLDRELDSVHPKWEPGTASIKSMYRAKGWRVTDGMLWHVVIAKPGGTGSGFVDEETWEGTGPTRRAAIEDAVAKAKEVQGAQGS